MPLKKPFRTSGWQEKEREFILVKITKNGFSGYGEVVAPKNPCYSSETVKTAWTILEDFLIPIITPDITLEKFHKKAMVIRGHQMAKAGLELALYDLKAKVEGKPLFELCGGIGGEVKVGVSVGIKNSLKDLTGEIAFFLNQGYHRIKIKIGKGWDFEVLRFLRKEFPEVRLWADANGCYDGEDLEYLNKIDEFDLELIEQPFPPDDLIDHAKLKSSIKTRICLDESIESKEDLLTAIALGAIDILNLKVGRVGGILESLRILNVCKEKDIPVWLGGMLESGIGRGHNLHFASNPVFSLPPDLSPSDRYYEDDIIEPPFKLMEGRLVVPTDPGIGVAVREDLIDHYTIHKKIF